MTRLTCVFVVAAHGLAANTVAQEPDARQILQRAIRAAGGKGAVARQKSPMMWMERGTFHGMGEAIPYVGQYAVKWPDWYRQEIEGVFTITVNRDSAWLSTGDSVQKLTGRGLDSTLQQVRVAWAERLFPLTDKAYELTAVDGIEVNGRATVGLRASHAKHRDVTLYFDRETYLLAKYETKVISPQHGPEPVLAEAVFEGHKSFGGVQIPSKFKLFYDEKLFVDANIVDYKMGATLDPAHFVAPQ